MPNTRNYAALQNSMYQNPPQAPKHTVLGNTKSTVKNMMEHGIVLYTEYYGELYKVLYRALYEVLYRVLSRVQ